MDGLVGKENGGAATAHDKPLLVRVQVQALPLLVPEQRNFEHQAIIIRGCFEQKTRINISRGLEFGMHVSRSGLGRVSRRLID